MPNQSNGYDDPKNLRRNREIRERSNSSVSSTDFIRLQAEERKRRVDGIEKSMARQKEAQDQIDKQLVNRENKDTNPPEFPFIRTKEYEDISANALQAAEGRRMETIVPESPKVEPQGLSQERQIELSKHVLSEIRLAGDSRRKPLVDTKFNSDRSISASDNTNASIYKREIEQMQELIDNDKGESVYAFFKPDQSLIYVTDDKRKAEEAFGKNIVDKLHDLGDRFKGVQRVELEFAKIGVEDENYRLKPKIELTVARVERLQDTKSDAVEAKEAEAKTVEMVRGNAFAKLGSEIRNQQVWSEPADSWKNPRMDFKVMKENEPLAFKNQEDGTVIITWDNNYSRPNETAVPLNYAERIINEKGIGGVKWDLPTVYALKSEPKNLGNEPEVIVTDHEETANALKEKWGYRSLGELKIGDRDTKTTNDQKWTSVKDFVGAANADKLPVWMQKEDIHIEDFIEYRDNKSLTPQEFMQLAQNKPLERESIPDDPDAWRNRFNPEDFRDFDQDKPFEHEVVGEAQEKKSFAENEKEYIARKDKLDEIYEQIEKLSARKAVSEEIADRKEGIDADLIQLDAMYQIKEKTTSQEVKDSYDRFYKEKFEDLEKTIEFMQKALDQSRRQDIPASSKRESKEEFVSSVEDALGKDGATDKTRQFSEKIYDDLKAKGVDETRMRLSMGIIEKNKENITTWLEDRETTEIDMNEASKWLMNQVDQLSQRRNDSYTNEPFADVRRQLEREMGPRGTGETRA